MLRTIFAFAFAALYLIFGIVCILINGLVGLFSRRSKDRLVSLYAKVGAERRSPDLRREG
jgi:hypothetical protein